MFNPAMRTEVPSNSGNQMWQWNISQLSTSITILGMCNCHVWFSEGISILPAKILFNPFSSRCILIYQHQSYAGLSENRSPKNPTIWDHLGVYHHFIYIYRLYIFYTFRWLYPQTNPQIYLWHPHETTIHWQAPYFLPATAPSLLLQSPFLHRLAVSIRINYPCLRSY